MRKTPPPAFPENGNEGMTLRDYFAAKAMAALIISGIDNVRIHDEKCARFSYEIADAMLLEREK